ncbi:MAG: beta-ketoacyl-[acyl-carrier-protein] synthase family protein, partial [Desulfovibrio sp.]|nr:beta-ketoacyl-[acyl-carrier-protein] synthase family protein [Desulfovibrio sp.]
ALEDARVRPCEVSYVNAHATATEYGDMAEGQAVAALFGAQTCVSSLKGHLGHTMAASGALRHLVTPVRAGGGPTLKNSFALGGCNCAVLFDTFQQNSHDG